MASAFLATAAFWVLICGAIVFSGRVHRYRNSLIGSGAACVACLGGWLTATTSLSIALPPAIASLVTIETIIYALIIVLLGLALAFLLRSFEAEKSLGFTQSRFQNMLLSANEGILEIDNDGVCTFSNLAAARLLGFNSPDQIMGRPAGSLLASTDEAAIPLTDRLGTAIKHRDVANNGDDVIRKADGSSFPARFSVSPLMHRGAPTGVVVTLVDITRQKNIQRALQEEEQNFRGLIENTPRGIFIHNHQGLLFANQSLATMFGYQTPEEVFKNGGIEAFLPRHLSAPFWQNETARLTGNHPDMSYEVDGVKKDGTIICLDHSGQSISWYGKRAVHSTLVDITQARHAASLQEKTMRVLRMAARASEVILQARHEKEMLDSVCKVIVEAGNYPGAWVAEKKNEENQECEETLFSLTAQCGLNKTTQKSWPQNWGDKSHAGTLLQQATQKGHPVVVADIFTTPRHRPLRREASQAAYGALCILPMRGDPTTTRVLTVCASLGETFPDEEVKVLLTLADNVATHLQTLRAQAELGQAISELKEAETLMRQSTEEAKLANRAKTDFLANMSHETRTPLNGILACSEAMQKQLFGPLGHPKYKEYIDDIHASGQHLLDILNDILDCARIERGKYAIHESRFALTDTIRAALRILRERIEERGITLKTLLPRPGPIIRADERAIKQIVINLVGNAAKFTPETGRINVALTTTNHGDLNLSVRDNGIGITPEDLKRITHPFVQGENVEVRKHHGAGLGLSLVRSLTQLHQGRLDMRSRVGKGTCVRIRLPAERVVDLRARHKTRPGASAKKLTKAVHGLTHS